MNTDDIIQSKKVLEEKINALVAEFEKEHNIYRVEISSCTHTLRMEGCFNVSEYRDINIIATVRENGTDIVIK